MKDKIRKIIPKKLLEANRKRKKNAIRKDLLKQKSKGEVITKSDLIEQFSKMGLVKGDRIMVHSSMSKIGFLENGPSTFIDALKDVIGKEGTILMPSSPVDRLQLDYLKKNRFFDVRNTPSKMGAISETFRKEKNVLRSAHPTEPVCAWGDKAKYFIEDHFGQITPYNLNSPWYRLMEQNGKVLYCGVTLINAGTHLHVLEDLVDFKYPVYYEDTFEVTIRLENGENQNVITKVHNPEFSKRRKCDELIPIFMEESVLEKHTLGKSECLLLDGHRMLKTMINKYNESGVTMYTPKGETIEGYD